MSDDSKLNGFRIPLIVNAITLIPIGGVLIGMWSDVQILKTDRADRVSPERLAKIEALLVVGTDGPLPCNRCRQRLLPARRAYR